MADKIKIAMSWAAACGGCDVALLDVEDRILDLLDVADVVFWPVAMDFKRSDLQSMAPDSIDIGLFNGAVRTSEQLEDAKLFREKCKVLVAFGSCACFGGIPGLANLASREELFQTVYQDTVSTDNEAKTRPLTECTVDGCLLTLPVLHGAVRSLDQVVDVDCFMPGCPPTPERVLDAVGVIQAYAKEGKVPPKGTVLASDKALCEECPRSSSRRGGRMEKIVQPHEILADPDRCFVDQGLICMGIATRAGCGHRCIQANMPCRGCFGPTPEMLDPGAEALSAFGSIAGEANENDVSTDRMKAVVKSVRDPAGTFYRFTLPKAILHRRVADQAKGR